MNKMEAPPTISCHFFGAGCVGFFPFNQSGNV
jgi:hypothetical protein